MLRTVLLLLLFVSFMTAQSRIIPEPRRYTERSGQFKVTSSVRLILGSGGTGEERIADVLNGELGERDGLSLKVSAEGSLRRSSGPFIFIGRPGTPMAKRLAAERSMTLTPEMKAEGYCIDVDAKGAVILAESEKGLFYGVQSLLQMLRRDGRALSLPAASVSDHPLQRMRGISDDVSRGQISTVENFKKIVRSCARYKLNVYMPYIEDVFLFKNHAALGTGRGALTVKEWKEIDDYAKRWFVEVIPVFETLGHWENILIHPDYVRYGEFPGAHTVNVSDEKVYAMLDEMIGEMAGAFSSPYFHMAADESWDVGLGANKERVAASDLATVHAEHYKRLFALIRKHGKRPVMYGDVILNHPDILKKIPNDVLIVDWAYGARFDYSSPEVFRAAGFPFLVSPAVWNFTGPFPNYLNTFLNIQSFSLDGYRNGSQGIICSNWNDFGGEALRELNYYGYAWTAECAWNPVTAALEPFDAKFFGGFFDAEQDELRSVYALLGSPANQYHWYELWRHPMLPNRDDMIWEKRLPLVQRMQSIRMTMPFVLGQLAEAEQEVTVNRSHLQYLAFAARLNLWFARKIDAQERIRLALKDTLMDSAAKGTLIAGLCGEVTADLAAVKEEFRRVWLTTNKPEGLDLLLKRYDRQAAYWNEMAASVRAGDFDLDPQLRSQWLYHPKANPRKKDSLQVKKAYFRTSVPLARKAVRSVKVQLLGDTWAVLYVNGTKAAEVMGRQSLSLLVENRRAVIADVAPLANDSLLVLAAEAQSFSETGSGGVNVIGEVVYADGAVQEFRSDAAWLASDTAAAGWNTTSFTPQGWLAAAPKPYPLPVIAPDLSSGRTSWYER